MSAAQMLSVLGGALGVAAAFCLWKASPFIPAGDQPIGGSEAESTRTKLAALHRWSAWGFGLLAAGFTCQTAAVLA